MTLELLFETKIGKSVNTLRHHETFGDLAKDLVKKWKELANSAAKNDEKSKNSVQKSAQVTPKVVENQSKVNPQKVKENPPNGLIKPKMEEKLDAKKVEKPRRIPENSTFTPDSGRFEDILSLGNLAVPKPKPQKVSVQIPKPPPLNPIDVSELQTFDPATLDRGTSGRRPMAPGTSGRGILGRGTLDLGSMDLRTDYRPLPNLKFDDEKISKSSNSRKKIEDEALYLKKHSKMQVFTGRRARGFVSRTRSRLWRILANGSFAKI